MAERTSDNEEREKIRREIMEEAKELKEDTENIIEALRVHHRNSNIAKATGTVASIGGTIAAVTGSALCLTGVLAPVGAPLAVGGVVAAATGTATSVGTSIVEHFISKDNLKQVQRKLESLQKKIKDFDSISLDLDPPNEFVEGLKRGASVVSAANKATHVVKEAVVTAKTLKTTQAVTGATRVLSKAFGKTFIAFNIILLPLDIIDLVGVSIKIHKRSDSPASPKLIELAKELERLANGEF